MARHFRTLFALAAVGSLFAGLVTPPSAGAAITSAVLTIDGQNYTRDDLQKELNTLTTNTDFVKTLQTPPKTGGKYDAAFVAQVLTNHLYTTIVHSVFAKHKLKTQRRTR